MMKRSMITNQALINQSKSGSGTEPTNTQRRALIGGALVALLSAPLLSAPRRVMAQGHAVPDDSFVLLLKGVYEPVVHAPDLGLSVNLNDGSYSKTLIYPVSGIPGNSNPNKTVGDFYVQFNGDLCAYHVPGGSFAMRFTGSDVTLNPDGLGGNFLDGTFELTIEEGTGIYRSFIGGHNHMVDHLHLLADGSADEYCFCFISRA
jgi:hypothetical protein